MNFTYSYHTPSQGVFKNGHNKHLLVPSLGKQFKFGGILSFDVSNLLNYKPSYYYESDIHSTNYTPYTNNISVQVFAFNNKNCISAI
ncbi:hypothetical protein HMPREF1199_00704 [Hoylesella oralis CC98A]|nr:hypothetical protein HMPREF1199_00704 [Hoylesella oralis CC98A]